ncbi:carbon-nitrogen hydrolase family protein [Catellatospora tritici]|uniref:carbon-nitrogen hydrolase family protein n=1 Tax=Catellatospora tritici TaxID=2851566 RepID=UPI001C2CD223|nr:carbon-nitrogen hydrolase family protein [Catellatospora tritici]MBV1852628.1 carbon-nitrogen hydrolase family protein [Catellatospora tritici]
MAPVRVAAVQLAAGQDVEANLAACLRLIDDAAAQGARLIVLPEFCNHLSYYSDRAQAHSLATRPGDPFLNAVADRARRHGVHVKINVTHAHADGRTGGTNFLFGPDGAVLGQCDKQTLMGAENDHLDPATEVGPVIDTPLGRLGMYACMEGVLNEVARGLALRGAQVLLNSLNSFATDEASLHIPVRAAENKVWVVAANKVGPLLPEEHLPRLSAALGVPPQWLHGAGESQIVAPDGTVVARGPRTGEAVVVADIDPDLADDKRRPDGTDILATRRPELYAPIAQPPRGRRRPAGAATLPVAVVRGDAATVSRETALAAAAGAQLVVVADADPQLLAAALDGTSAHAVARAADGSTVLVSATGTVAVQQPLHGKDADGAGPLVVDLPWGLLALVAGADSIYPEVFRLAALADADVVAVPFTAAESWELSLGLPERAAENRLNLVAAAPLEQDSAVFAMSPDFTLWTSWQGPFTGRISHPVVTVVPAGQPSGRAEVAPAQAANRLVSRNTDLVDGRPWRLLQALTER